MGVWLFCSGTEGGEEEIAEGAGEGGREGGREGRRLPVLFFGRVCTRGNPRGRGGRRTSPRPREGGREGGKMRRDDGEKNI
jgi:hypothetical protein